MLILADDLTGAADCAAVCLRLGLSAYVALDVDVSAAADVLSIDADTRSLDALDAADRTRSLIERAGVKRGQIFFKKVDSTLRGHLGAELAATLKTRRAMTGRRTFAVLAPAFPAADRVTRGGRQFVKGVPLEETEIWQREGSGPDASIAVLLERAGLRHAHLPLPELRSRGLAMRLGTLGDIDVLVCDAETDDDLAALAAAALALHDDIVWSGSAGLAGHLARAIGLHPQPSPEGPPRLRPGLHLFVVGSMSSVSRQQVAALMDSENILPLRVPVSALLGRSADDGRLADAVRANRDVVLLPEADIPDDPRHAQALRQGLAALVAPIAGQLGGLFLTGGETARAVLVGGLHVAGLHVLRELEPGIPLSIANGPHPLAVVTKAGAFGKPGTMVDALRALRELAGHPPVLSPEAKNGSVS